MTCIVGVADGSTVTLAADSASSDGWRMRVAMSGKFVSLRYLDPVGAKRMVLGFTTSWRMGQLLPALGSLPEYGGSDPHHYLVSRVIPKIRTVFKDGGYAKVDSNVETGGTFLIGFDGKLFTVEDDYGVLEYDDSFAAVGSGWDYATPAMWATLEVKPETDTRELLTIGLRAAERYITTVRGPFSSIDTMSGQVVAL